MASLVVVVTLAFPLVAVVFCVSFCTVVLVKQVNGVPISVVAGSVTLAFTLVAIWEYARREHEIPPPVSGGEVGDGKNFLLA